MKPTIQNLVLAISLAALGNLTTQAQPATNQVSSQAIAEHPHGPKIQFDQNIHDFGKITGGAAVKHTFVFTNIGDQLLELSNVQPSCGCTTAGEWSRKVEPGQTGTIPIQFNSGNFSGEIHKTITVTSNDKSQPQAVLQLKGSIWKPIEVTPQFAMLNLTQESPSNAPTKVKIVNNTDTPLTLSPPECSNKAINVDLQTVKPGKEFELTVSAVPPVNSGTLQGTITIKTSSTNMPLISVTAWANIQPVIAVMPQQIVLPRPPLLNKVSHSVTIQNHGTNQLALTEPKVNVEGVEVDLKETQPGRAFSATVTFPQGFEVQPGKAVELTFKSNHPLHPLIKVPVMQTPRQPAPVQGLAPKTLPATPRPTVAPVAPPPPPATPANAGVTPRQSATQ
jgi:hypothetical protein